MTVAGAYADLVRLDRAVVTTREAAARWRIEQRAAGQRLNAMADAGLVRRLRRGLWALDPEIDPFVVPPFLTAPHPAYISFWSALHRHGLIEQIPRRISVASLDRSRRIDTSVGTFQVHHIAPELFTGYEEIGTGVYLASTEKALFDTVYVRNAAAGGVHLPELTLPPGFDREALRGWTRLIGSERLRTLVAQSLTAALDAASAEHR